MTDKTESDAKSPGCELCARFRFGPLKLADGVTNQVLGRDIVPICGAVESTVFNHRGHDATACRDYRPLTPDQDP